ncbi:family 78 glycoside hydrolase catalytic domain [Fimbriimonas ginsengisoli]|uniref:alpha-L-rhamnosidase n=1 Tax=Fimbriimonas ginsengisoli Gsoil 348 TaxID=661478 RepID=A0A068NWB7_FIMGI|nr:family 78 glycoside hydrolase catalytic domain [Fimbriimonas ginsengisoli]AIE85899.1 alpha-L-rhamnosidase, putative [Fimbriimonas ginsengisoli Gsoil 348]
MTFLPAAVLLTASASGPTVTDLRCEYLKNPISIESPAPRLSWVTEYEGRGWKQTAYQILVASDARKLGRSQADLWDSGRVASSASIQIPYSGKALSSRQRCFWKVRVWDGAGEPSAWSKPQIWEMGLSAESDWAASKWIGGAPAGKGQPPAPFLRKEFVAKGKVKRATLYASGLGYAELHLNGKKVGGTTERDPGYTNFDKRVLYVAHDVTSAIKPGANAVGAILGTGWYDVHDLATWRFENAPWRGRPRLRLALYIDYADGSSETVVSDPSWKTSTGPILFDGIYTGEVYDARQEMPDWDSAGFSDAAWSAAAVMPAPKGALAARPCPPVAIVETIKAKRILEPAPGVYVVDFGQNIAGHARIRVKGAAGTKITMRYSERIKENGAIERDQIETFMTKATPPQPFQTDTYICKGEGREEWEQRFSYSGFRYMEVTGFPGKPRLDSFQARLASTDFESAGEFECSNDLLNKIQHATRYAYLSNAQSIPTDCPQREKNGWTGDAHLAAEAGLMNFKSASFYTKWLDDLADDQSSSGAQSLIVPSGGWGHGATHPAWDSAYPIIANDLYRYCGDTRIFTRHYEHLRRYVDYLSAQTQDGVVPFDSLGDWLPWSTETPSQLTSTVFLYVDARIVADAARMQGNDRDTRKYADLAEQTKRAFDKHYLAPDALEKSSQTALSMAIYFGLAEGDKKQAAFDALVRNVKTQGHIDTGILGAKYLLRVLSEGGRSDLAYMLVARKEQPGWGWWIGQGATTLWEDWKGESSLNHIMFGDVSNWFYQWIAGIGLDPATPAFKHVLIRPQPVSDLTWAKATEHGPYGLIRSSWQRNGAQFHLDIEIPPNTSATVYLPGSGSAPDGAKLLRREGNAMLFEVGSGRHSFQSQLSPSR